MADIPLEELRRIFDLVFAAPLNDREAILARECGDNAELQRRIEAMIVGAEDERFLGQATVDRSATLMRAAMDAPVAPLIESPGTIIGPYKLLQLIGEGGFGSVFMAEQSVPVSRKVALKIVKLGMDTRQVVARFEQERQALAVMDHPHIARVFDAGATPTGRPYFAMELVAGEAITTYCDKHKLPIDQRLTLFTQVCQAVQHAHQKGVIHRDIKPSNVIVSTHDGKPFAKVIDFGIAKAVASKLTEKTLFTEHKQLIGTPHYMSPEQAEGSLDIDTRTDVYSLGVLLYELLTGTTPFDDKTLRKAAYGEIERIIREVEPPRPSTRLKQSGDMIASVATLRNVEPRKLGTIVRGELDWIVMKALEKDRQRRYESPNALQIDIQRYLSGEAVQAAPPHRLYFLRKFARRNKGSVAATVAVGLALAVGVVAFAWQARVARGERDRAVRAEAETAARASELQKVSDFQSQMLSQVDATAAGLRLTADVRAKLEAALTKAGVPAKERAEQSAAFAAEWSRVNSTDVALELIDSTILSPAMSAIDRQFANEPKLSAKLRSAISQRYINLGLYDRALGAFDQVFNTRRTSLGEDDSETVEAALAKCKVLTLLGRSLEAELILRPLLKKQRDHQDTQSPVFFSAVESLGEAVLARGNAVEAESLFRESLAGRRKVLGDDNEFTLMSMGNLSMALQTQAKYAEAAALTEESLKRRERIYGEQNNYTLTSYNNLAVIYLNQGRLQEAADLFKKAADGRRTLLGDAHRDTILAVNNLAATYQRLDRYAEAETIQRDLLERTRRVLGPDHPDSIMILSNLASTLISLGKLDEAEPLCRETLERRIRVQGVNDRGTLTANNIMAYLLREQKKDAEAEPYLRAALDASRTVWGIDHPERLVLLLNMGSLALDLGRPVESETLLREALERTNRALGPTHPYSLLAVRELSETLYKEKQFAECAQLLAGAESNFRTAAAKNDQGDLRRLLIGLGKSRTQLRDFASAETSLKEAHARYLELRGPIGAGTQQCVQALIDLYDAWNAAEPTADHASAAAEWRTRLAPPSSQPATAPASKPTSAPSR